MFYPTLLLMDYGANTWRHFCLLHLNTKTKYIWGGGDHGGLGAGYGGRRGGAQPPVGPGVGRAGVAPVQSGYSLTLDSYSDSDLNVQINVKIRLQPDTLSRGSCNITTAQSTQIKRAS